MELDSHSNLEARAPKALRTVVARAKVFIEGSCVRIVIDSGIDELLDDRGLLHGAALSSIAIVAAEIALSTLLEHGKYVAINSFTSFIRQSLEPSTIALESCVESRTPFHASITTTVLADGIEVAKNTTLFLKLEGEEWA